MERSQTVSRPTDDESGVDHVLVVLNEVFQGTELEEAMIDHLAGQEVRMMVVAPALVESGLDHEMGQIDKAVGPARQRLDLSLERLRQIGIEAIGEVGDSDPVLAIGDELQKFPADEIILIAHGEEDRAYAERGLLERVHHNYALPITQLTVTRPHEHEVEDFEEPDEEPHLLGTVHEPAELGESSATVEATENFPPLRIRDIVAMVFGLVGSIVLVILAAASALSDPGSGIEGASAAKMLIAIAALLINAAHVVALIFFQSVRYEGVFERFASRFTIIGTSIAIIVSLLI